AEIRMALEAGVPREGILYTGAYPRDDELAAAIDARVAINLDDPALLPRLLAHGTPPALSFRVNPGETEAGPEGLRFAGHDAKFGAPLDPVVDGLTAASAAGVPRLGLHTMPGSNILNPAHFGRVGRFLATAVERIRAETGRELAFLDMGGGLGVPYRPGETTLDVREVAERVTAALRAAYPEGGAPPPTLLAEPGRYLVCDSTILVTRVSHVKAHRVPFVGVDAGMNTLLRPALYDAYHPVYPVDRRDGEPRVVQQIGGPVCENTDVLARDRWLPELRPGDLLAIGNVGAYGFSMSSQYNSRPRPAELLVRGTEAHRIRDRETFEDLVAHTHLPPYLQGRPGAVAAPSGGGR
ncbi:diaminopimelate decarboxylase, partial [mine drainage metagenome]